MVFIPKIGNRSFEGIFLWGKPDSPFWGDSHLAKVGFALLGGFPFGGSRIPPLGGGDIPLESRIHPFGAIWLWTNRIHPLGGFLAARPDPDPTPSLYSP